MCTYIQNFKKQEKFVYHNVQNKEFIVPAALLVLLLHLISFMFIVLNSQLFNKILTMFELALKDRKTVLILRIS